MRCGKGKKDRNTLLPGRVVGPLTSHLGRKRLQHERDLEQGAGYVEMPDALGRKYPNAARVVSHVSSLFRDTSSRRRV